MENMYRCRICKYQTWMTYREKRNGSRSEMEIADEKGELEKHMLKSWAE